MKFTEYDKAIMIGLLLGDGYISPNGRVCIEHCKKQKEYCIYKAKLLHSVCGGKDINVHELERAINYKKDGKIYKVVNTTTYSFKKQSKSFLYFRNALYKNNVKTITNEILDMLQPISIALWWLDDGCLTKKYNKGYEKEHYMLRLYTYLSKKENELIQKYFIDNYDMYWNVVKVDEKNSDKYYLRCGDREGRKFLNIIHDYVVKIPSMTYKLIDI